MLHRRGVGCALLFGLLLLGGCWSSPTVVEDAVFAGPPVAESAAEGRHLLVVSSPTPGWLVTIDRTENLLDDTLVFLTMQRPDPGALYAQVTVEQRLLTDVAESRPIRVYARVIDFGQRKHLPPYRPMRRKAAVSN